MSDMQTHLSDGAAGTSGQCHPGGPVRAQGRRPRHAWVVTILGVAAASLRWCCCHVILPTAPFLQRSLLHLGPGGLRHEVGFLIDQLTVMMMLVVTFVSLMVHIYTIGYMHDDPGYQRFFSYISLFTFSML